jgi:Bifunctional DNA primase/polymerase, N-terminal/AAA domain/Primase C terminal 1 (PriCT-1)
MTEIGTAALRYAHLGLSVIPLRSKGKIPIFQEWQKVATCEENQVTRWFQQNPESNVGIATGPKSNCFVLDVDIAKGGQDSFDTLLAKHGQFPDTWQQITGSGGFHLFFRYPNFRVSNANDLMPGIDIRGDGGQVVAPPSIHPTTGKRYEWDGLKDIEDTPMAEAPMWLLDLLQGKQAPETKTAREPLADRIPNGTRHQALVSLAGAMRRFGLNSHEMLPTLREVNRTRCEEPKPEDEIRHIAESMMKYQPADTDLFKTTTKLWRILKAREIEQENAKQAAAAKLDKIKAKAIDGLSVYRTPQVEHGCLVDGLIYNGLTLFAGAPKSAKSYLALQLALAVANGNKFLDQRDVMTPGLVLYVALEEGPNRTSSRMRKLQKKESIYLQNISMVYSLLPLMCGGLEQLRLMAKEKSPSLIIIDTFLALVGNGNGKRDVLRSEYGEMNTLHTLAQENETAVFLIHHKRKTVAGSTALDSVSGSTGLTAAADSIWTIDKQPDSMSCVSITGRDTEDQTLSLKFGQDPFGWQLIGTGDAIKTMTIEREIYAVLREEGAQTPAKLAVLLRMNVNQVRSAVYDLSARGFVNRASKGAYSLAPDKNWESQ